MVLPMNGLDLQFSRNVVAGSLIRDVIWQLLEKSGYVVLPYGYEVSVPYVRQRLAMSSTKSRILDRFRSSPDILVIDEQKEQLSLVEVKWRNWSQPYIDASYLALSKYKRYWPETILVLVVPNGNYFYAQYVAKLRPGRGRYKLTTSFKKIEKIFPRITQESVSQFRVIIDRFVAAGST
jgi:hypothetical protein